MDYCHKSLSFTIWLLLKTILQFLSIEYETTTHTSIHFIFFPDNIITLLQPSCLYLWPAGGVLVLFCFVLYLWPGTTKSFVLLLFGDSILYPFMCFNSIVLGFYFFFSMNYNNNQNQIL